MKPNFFISTTNNIEGGTIKEYLDVVCTNTVIGTNIFSDIAASFTDFFGGQSDTYKKKLELLYDKAIKELKQKAIRIGANAIIGLRIDFDEISGKDKSMFMISVSGTACVIEYLVSSKKSIQNSTNSISQTDLDTELERQDIISQLKGGSGLKYEEWIEFLIKYPQTELAELLINLYVKYNSDSSWSELSKKVETIISVYPKEIIIPIIYNQYLKTADDSILLLINSLNLFDASSVLNICKQDIHLGIKLLSVKSDYYNSDSVNTMQEIHNMLTKLPDTGKIEKIKSGIFNKKEEDSFICQKGHKNSTTLEFCDNCGLNIKGLNREEVKHINDFNKKINAILNLMNEKH